MTYKVIRDEHGSPIITLTDEQPYSYTLSAAPIAREPELNAGVWLVMAFAVWSIPDTLAIQTALDVAKRFNGKIHLGVRPFDQVEEFGTWCPELENSEHSPLWVLLRDGKVCMIRTGIFTIDELVEAIEGVHDLHERSQADG